MPWASFRPVFRNFDRRSIFDWNRDFRPCAALAVFLVHAAVAYWLLNFGAGSAHRTTTHAPDPWVLQVVFLPARALRGVQHAVNSRQPKTVRATRDGSIDPAEPPHDDEAQVLEGSGPDRKVARPLRLQLPDAPVVAIGSRDPLSRPAAVDYVPTRFEEHWITQGDALKQAAWRHKSVAIALSLFGGGGHICTEEDKRRRMRGCSPAIDAGLEDADPASGMTDLSSAR